ncbi:PIG-L deacetylase family protein [Micromonospora sp. NPDC018662]|uniref:PIG-L deacetylase family protein n=1 Tax=Micromonospora sp. NPDC018662 TaxID=3364238 RepID=UPI0037B774DA
MSPVPLRPPVDPAWRVVVLSTHFDDAALSLGGLLRATPGPKAVVTVHGGPPPPGSPLSSWDADCGFLAAEEAHRVRLAEDARACALLGADQVVLDNPDNPYRAEGRLAGLTELLDALAPDVRVYLPLATNQPDHARVRDAALAWFTTRSRPRPRPRVYADLPYTAIVPGWAADPAAAIAGAADGTGAAYRALAGAYGLTPVPGTRLPDDIWAGKRDAVLCYASQLSLVGAMDEVRGVGALLSRSGPLRSELTWELGPGPA